MHSNYYLDLRTEFASRVIYDPDCKECLRDDQVAIMVPGWPEAERNAFCRGAETMLEAVHKAFGFEPNAHNAGHTRPCAACRERRPFAWLKDVSLDDFTAHVRRIEAVHGDYAWSLHLLHSLQLSGVNPVAQGLAHAAMNGLARNPEPSADTIDAFAAMNGLEPSGEFIDEAPFFEKLKAQLPGSQVSLSGCTPELKEALRTGDFSKLEKPIIPIKNDREFF